MRANTRQYERSISKKTINIEWFCARRVLDKFIYPKKKKKKGTLTSMSFLKRALSVHIFDVIFVLELGERSLKIFEIQRLANDNKKNGSF